MSPELLEQLLIRAEQVYQNATADPRAGRRAAHALIAEAADTGADEARVVGLRAAAFAARELYDHDEARRLIDDAVAIARRGQLWSRLAESLVTRSAIHLEMGHPTVARRDLATAGRVADPATEPEVQFASGLLEDTTGNTEAAVQAYRRVIDAPTTIRPDLRFKALNNLGLVLLRLARYDEAECALHEALQLAETFSPMYVGYAAESRATAAVERGLPVEAMQRYEHAEAVHETTGIQLVDLYLGKANALLTLRLLDEATDAARRAVDQVDGRAGGSLMLAECLLTQARVNLECGDLDGAAEAARRAEDLFRRQRRPGWRARAALLHTRVAWERGIATPAMTASLARIERTMRRLGNVPATAEAALLHGEVAASLGRKRRALAAFDRAAATARGPALLRLRGRIAAARKAQLQGDTRRLSLACRLGLDELAAYRATFASAELRARAAAHGSALAEIGLGAAVRSGRAESIWSWMERSRAVVTVREGSPVPDHVSDADLARLRGLERDLIELPPDDVTEQARLLREIAQLERRIRRWTWQQRSDRTAVIMPSVASLRSLRSDLRRRALLQYAVLDDRVLGVVVTADTMRVADLASTTRIADSSRHLAAGLRRLSRPRSQASVDATTAGVRHELTALGELLVLPFADRLGAAEEIVVVPPGQMIGIPWGALPPLEARPVRVAPTATLWGLTRDRTPPSDRVILVAGPDLPAAAAEVSSIAGCYPRARTLTGPGATVDAVRSEAAGARTVHLACHGRLRRDTAAFSSLHLTDGPLTVHDLEQLPTAAHTWILAACDLGSPGELVGPELDGVVATLLLGGAAGVVAAVVSVPDLETQTLMTDLHAALVAGSPLAEAVQIARRRADTSEPAGFVASLAFSCYGGG